MPEPISFDAVVIGGGPAGATSALALAKLGWSVAVVEKAAYPRRKVCGEFMSATSLAVIDQLGIGEAWRAQAGPQVRRLALFAGEDVVEAPVPATRSASFGRALGRDVLDEMLLATAKAAGAEVFQPCRAVALSVGETMSTVEIVHRGAPATLRAPVVIAAHGSWERGSLPTQLEKVNNPSDLLGFKAHFRGVAMAPDLMPLLAFPGGYGGLAWADHGRLSVSYCLRRDALARIRKAHDGSAAEAVHSHLLATCRGVREVFGDAEPDEPWVAAGPMRPGFRHCHDGGVFYVGNAAGESHSIIAEGISMAIQSAWLLTKELSRVNVRTREGQALAGRRYTTAWRRQFNGRVRAATAFAWLATRPDNAPVARAVMRAAPSLLTFGARLAGKTATVPSL